MNKLEIKLFSVTCLLILNTTYLILSPPSAFAQQVTLSMSPPIIETIIQPGKSILVAYTVTNSGDPVTIRTKIRTFSPQGYTGALHISEGLSGPVRFSLDNANLQLEQPPLMRSGVSQQAVVRMRIPEGTPEGDYYYVFLAETESSPNINGSSGSVAKATVGSPLLITVSQSGKLQVKGTIESFRLTPRYTFNLFDTTYQIVNSSDKVSVSLTLKNEGNNMFKPNGSVVIKGAFGDTLSRDLIPQNILSDSSRTVNCNPDCIFSSFFIGPYTVSATVRLHEASPALTAVTTFIGIPFKFIIGLFIALAVIFSIIIRKKQNTSKSQT